MIGTIEKLNNPNVDIFELQTDFLNSIQNCVIDKDRLDLLMTTMITNQETIGLSNVGLDKKRQVFMNTADIFYNNKIQEITLTNGMTR